MKKLWWNQLLAIARLELKKTFFAKRGLWIYLLALAPVALFTAQVIIEVHMHGVRHQMALENQKTFTRQDLESISAGMTRDDVIAKLGNPAKTEKKTRRVRHGRQVDSIKFESLHYSNNDTELVVFLEKDVVAGQQTRTGISLGDDSYIFAGVFQFFFIRLAVCFGCLGIFMNLFRGEMLDKSLHYYLLAPVRREVLLVGKYLAGLTASAVIFTTSTALQIFVLSFAFDSNTVNRFLFQDHGIGQIGVYLGVTVLACIGYGSVFLAAGLLFKNPMIAAAIVVVWEAANPLLPSLLKKFSVIYYLKALCPVQIPTDPGMPALMSVLVSAGDPISGYLAVLGLIGVSVIVLWISSFRVKRLEINYTTE